MMTATDIADFNSDYDARATGDECPLCKAAKASQFHLATFEDEWSAYVCPCCYYLEEQSRETAGRWDDGPQQRFEAGMQHMGYSSREVIDHR